MARCEIFIYNLFKNTPVWPLLVISDVAYFGQHHNSSHVICVVIIQRCSRKKEKQKGKKKSLTGYFRLQTSSEIKWKVKIKRRGKELDKFAPFVCPHLSLDGKSRKRKFPSSVRLTSFPVDKINVLSVIYRHLPCQHYSKRRHL